ncbi:MAG: hypothetical protein RBS14_00090 [Atribacterota bacterium]|nr:hypothetical protein [Atribacterota bacterium]
MTWLNLSVNQLTTLPPELSQLTELSWLNLTGNPLSDSEVKKVHRLLPNCDVYFL